MSVFFLTKGFKHVYKPVQIAAYTAWKNVIDNFSANLGENCLLIF